MQNDTNVEETGRDREHLRALFLLRAQEEPVGPSELSKIMDISRAGALKKMKKVEELGYGEYIPKKGIRLNREATQTIKDDIERHHALEIFLKRSLGLSDEEACKESSSLEEHVSERLIEKICDEFEEELSCDCGYCIDPDLDPDVDELYRCHWVKKSFSLPDNKMEV